MGEPLSENSLREYLLGTGSEAQKEAVEHAFLTDERENERVLIVEEELIDDYLEGDLKPTERERFENYFLLPQERRQQLASVRALRDFARNQSVMQPQSQRPSNTAWLRIAPIMVPSMAALLIVFAIVSVILYMRNQQLRSQIAQEGSQLARQTGQDRLPPGEFPKLAPFEPIILRPGLARELGEMLRIQVPVGAATVTFELPISGQPYPSYSVVLHSAEGEELWSQARLAGTERPSGVAVYVSVPASLLQAGDYQFSLSGVRNNHSGAALASYNFSVRTK